MPYTLRPYNTGFRVYNKEGEALSSYPMTKAMATRQLHALYAHVKDLRGGSSDTAKDKQEDDEIREYPLSDADIKAILPGLHIISYPELNEMSDIEEAFDDKGRCLILYLTENESTGHWVCMLKNAKTIEYFDPYGKYRPDEEREWLSKDKLIQLDQYQPTLTELLRRSRYKVHVNPYHFQKDKASIATCGRHCVCRLYHQNMSLPAYNDMIKDSGMSPDDYVSAFTYRVLKH